MFKLPTVPIGLTLINHLSPSTREEYGNPAVLLLGPRAYDRDIEVSERLGYLGTPFMTGVSGLCILRCI